MNSITLISDLTETQILSAVLEKFKGELVADMDMDKLTNESETLGDLFGAIQSEIDMRDRGGKAPGVN